MTYDTDSTRVRSRRRRNVAMRLALEEPETMLVRQVFQAKYGHSDELVALFREFHANADVPNRDKARILTDASGQFFTVITEYEVESFAAWEEAFQRLMGGPEMGAWFARMMEVTEGGRREFYNIVS